MLPTTQHVFHPANISTHRIRTIRLGWDGIRYDPGSRTTGGPGYTGPNNGSGNFDADMTPTWPSASGYQHHHYMNCRPCKPQTDPGATVHRATRARHNTRSPWPPAPTHGTRLRSTTPQKFLVSAVAPDQACHISFGTAHIPNKPRHPWPPICVNPSTPGSHNTSRHHTVPSLGTHTPSLQCT